jgi:hypothetical protein
MFSKLSVFVAVALAAVSVVALPGYPHGHEDENPHGYPPASSCNQEYVFVFDFTPNADTFVAISSAATVFKRLARPKSPKRQKLV